MANKIKIKNIPNQFKRQSQKREPKVIRCSILIVCEGTKTEPNYFKSFSAKQKGIIIYDVKVEGLGRSPKDVVKKAIDLKNKNNYDRVWAVFDKDEFTAKDFNDAITMGSNSGVDVAWSNEAFELWYLYHFYNVITGVSRTKYGEMISEAVNNSPQYKSKKKYQYKKNDLQNFQVMNTYGSMDSAIKFAKTKHLEYLASDYANQNPCTTVYRLVLQLLGKDEKLNEELMKDVED